MPGKLLKEASSITFILLLVSILSRLLKCRFKRGSVWRIFVYEIWRCVYERHIEHVSLIIVVVCAPLFWSAIVQLLKDWFFAICVTLFLNWKQTLVRKWCHQFEKVNARLVFGWAAQELQLMLCSVYAMRKIKETWLFWNNKVVAGLSLVNTWHKWNRLLSCFINH